MHWRAHALLESLCALLCFCVLYCTDPLFGDLLRLLWCFIYNYQPKPTLRTTCWERPSICSLHLEGICKACKHPHVSQFWILNSINLKPKVLMARQTSSLGEVVNMLQLQPFPGTTLDQFLLYGNTDGTYLEWLTNISGGHKHRTTPRFWQSFDTFWMWRGTVASVDGKNPEPLRVPVTVLRIG